MRKIILLVCLMLTITSDIYAGPRGRHRGWGRGHHKGWRHPPRPPLPPRHHHGRPPAHPHHIRPPHR